jgi:hypothetical protein
MLALVAFAAGHQYERHVDVLPQDVCERLSLHDGELPRAYAPLTDGEFLKSMGMRTNPDYVGNLSEMESIAQRGGVVSFLGAYGTGEQARVMVNGVLFRNDKLLGEFIDFQKEKKRPVVILKKIDEQGTWLLIVARDPTAEFADAERQQISRGIAKYGRRVPAETIFDDMWPSP